MFEKKRWKWSYTVVEIETETLSSLYNEKCFYLYMES